MPNRDLSMWTKRVPRLFSLQTCLALNMKTYFGEGQVFHLSHRIHIRISSYLLKPSHFKWKNPTILTYHQAKCVSIHSRSFKSTVSSKTATAPKNPCKPSKTTSTNSKKLDACAKTKITKKISWIETATGRRTGFFNVHSRLSVAALSVKNGR